MNEVKMDTKRLDEIARGLGVRSRDVMLSLAMDLEALAKELAPVDTGALRNSIYTEPVREGKIVARVGPSVEYALWQEIGTYKMPAHPYIVPAAEEVARKLNSGETWLEIFK